MTSTKLIYISAAIMFLVLLNGCSSVQFFRHRIRIPFSNSGQQQRHLTSANYHKQFNSPRKELLDSAVQFLISNEGDGSYHFGFDTGDDPKIYREEIREKSGRVTGKYGYIDPEGILRITEYVADSKGFRSTESQHIIFDTSNIQVIGPIPKPIKNRRQF